MSERNGKYVPKFHAGKILSKFASISKNCDDATYTFNIIVVE